MGALVFITTVTTCFIASNTVRSFDTFCRNKYYICFFLSFYAHIEARFVFNNTITNPTLNVQMCLSKSFMVLEVICNHVWYTKVISMLSLQIATRSFINEGCMCNLFRFWISHLCRQFAYMLPVWTVRTLNVARDFIRVSRTIYTSTPDSISYNVKRFPLYESCGYFWRE